MALRLVTVQNVNKITILTDFALYVTFYSRYLNQFLQVVHFWFNIFTFKRSRRRALPAGYRQQEAGKRGAKEEPNADWRTGINRTRLPSRTP
ncbi:hypothetical protein Dda3937_04550 [Dickeya dadantii 3937]|uniref:Uncharacterized protein n=1 Tax=Dickeya dadantii (strain 3937) TaxID=198628 RepID=E0SLY9_DICD3|nr:hypothetical protein Dda3937_04550 [Dickeya dadantii 3937]